MAVESQIPEINEAEAEVRLAEAAQDPPLWQEMQPRNRKCVYIHVVGINGAQQDPTSLDTICDTMVGPAFIGPVNVVSAGVAWENGWSRIRDDWHDEVRSHANGWSLVALHETTR